MCAVCVSFLYHQPLKHFPVERRQGIFTVRNVLSAWCADEVETGNDGISCGIVSVAIVFTVHHSSSLDMLTLEMLKSFVISPSSSALSKYLSFLLSQSFSPGDSLFTCKSSTFQSSSFFFFSQIGMYSYAACRCRGIFFFRG